MEQQLKGSSKLSEGERERERERERGVRGLFFGVGGGMRRGMEMESEDVEEELEEMSGGLDTPRGAAPETEEGGGGEAEQRSVYYDEDQEGGFNIFHIFEKGKDTHVQSSEQVPEKKINWISSIFKVDRSKTKESEPEASATEALAHSDVRINATEQTTRDAEISDDRFSGPPGVSFEEQMDDQPELHDSVTQTISTSEAMIQTKELIYAGVKDNDGRMRDDSGVDATKITSQSDQIIQSSEATTTEVLAHSDVRINVLEQTARDTEISNDRLSGPSSVSFKGHMEDQSELHDPATQTITTLGAMFQIKESIDAGVKENDVRLRMMDESGVDASKITFQNEQIIQDSETNATEVLTHSDIAINVAEQTARVSYKEQTEDQPELQDPSTQTISTSEAMIQIKELIDDGVNDNDVRMKDDSGVDANKITSQSDQIIQGSETSTTEVLAHSDVRINVAEQTARDTEISNDWDILKSIVYGGLNESITSLAVVSSAAGADVSTLKIVALGLAKLIGGFLLITHELFELRTAQDEATEQKDEQGGRYWELLGWRANFRRHFAVATISYILFGLVPPVVYGFSFRRSDEKEFKLMLVAASSLLCTALLALCKAHVKPQKGYVKTMVYYLVLGVSACGPSYLAGMMIDKLLEKLGLFDHGTTLQSPPTLMCQDLREPSWTSYW